MIIYNVTIKVEHAIADEWVQWMRQEHMPELMDTGLFTANKLCRLLEQDDEDGITFIAQYFCNGLTEYNRYISEYAQGFRDKGLKKFGERFIAFRTVMEEVG